MTSHASSAAGQSGFTYVGVLALVIIMGIVASATGELWRTERRRQAEADLLFVGNQYRQAIGRYYNQGPGRVKMFPRSLDDLLQDPRSPGVRRYLRKRFFDPITGSDEWGLIQGPTGEIMGVYSLSEEAPIKKGNFRRVDAKFEGKEKYAEWVFIYTPVGSSGTSFAQQPQGATSPATKPTANQSPGGPRVLR